MAEANQQKKPTTRSTDNKVICNVCYALINKNYLARHQKTNKCKLNALEFESDTDEDRIELQHDAGYWLDDEIWWS